MVTASFKLREDYWDNFQLTETDIEFLYNYLLETETPITNSELLEVLIAERIRKEKLAIEEQRSSGCDIYIPKDHFEINQKLVFPALNWQRGKVIDIRPGVNPDIGTFGVIRVEFDSGDEREYASDLFDHTLNTQPVVEEIDKGLEIGFVLSHYKDTIIERLETGLKSNSDFVRIAGRWFPRALLVDINSGHLNLAEAVLDMAGGGPLKTENLLAQIELISNVNSKLLEFSLDYALEKDPRFDEVGAAGEVLWFLHRLEPQPVLEPPICLKYQTFDYDRTQLSEEMLELEKKIDDELIPIDGKYLDLDEVEVCLIYPHWRVGTFPLTVFTRNFFPTAYEAPRIRFTIVDGDSGEKFPAWVVRPHGYVYGLKEWYDLKGLMPGSLIKIRKGKKAGEVILQSKTQRSSREWIRTVLVGSDGGVVFALLKHMVVTTYDERMAIVVPDVKALDEVWEKDQKERQPFERVVVNMARELTKLNPQSHVHASELYAAVNIVRRSPPGPIMSILASRPWFIHVGDLHFRFSDTERP